MKPSEILVPIIAFSLVIGAFVGVSRCDKEEPHNSAIDFIHMVIPTAECKPIETSPYFPTGAATCKAGAYVLYCQAGQFVEPHCVKVADLSPPPATSVPATLPK